jgi:hypothetical protein
MKDQNKYTKQQKDCLDKLNNLYNELKSMDEKEREVKLYVSDDPDYILDLFNSFNDEDKKSAPELLNFLSSKSTESDKCPMIYLVSEPEDEDEKTNYIIVINFDGKLQLAFCDDLEGISMYLGDQTEFPKEFHMNMFKGLIDEREERRGSPKT